MALSAPGKICCNSQVRNLAENVDMGVPFEVAVRPSLFAVATAANSSHTIRDRWSKWLAVVVSYVALIDDYLDHQYTH